MITSPELATPEWLTAALTAGGAAPPGARVGSVTAADIGAGQVARTVRFELRWSDGTAAPPTVIGKFPSADERSRCTGVASGAYERELQFYRHLAPAVATVVPRCHLADFDPATGGFALLLSDAASARRFDQVHGASPADTATALAALGRLHGRFWGAETLAGHRWLPIRGAGGGRRAAAIYLLMAEPFLARFGDRLSDAARDVVTGFGQRVRRWAAADRPPFTLLHGDFRVDNLLFGDGPDTSALTILDWQTVTVGPGPSDAAYLVGGTLPTGVRRACECDLYRHYLDTLRAAGVDPDEAHCRRSYVLGSLAGLHMTVVGAMLTGRDPASDEMFLSMAERHCAHVTDLEAFDVLDRAG